MKSKLSFSKVAIIGIALVSTQRDAAAGTSSPPANSDGASHSWISVTRGLQYDFSDYPPEQGGRHGTLRKWEGWTPKTATETIGSEIAWPALANIIASAHQFPEEPPSLTPSSILNEGGSASLIPNPPCYHASLTSGRYWVRIPRTIDKPYIAAAILQTGRKIGTSPEVKTYEFRSITVAPGQKISADYVDLLPSFTTNPSGNTSQSETVSTNMFPVEINFTHVVGVNDPPYPIPLPGNAYINDMWGQPAEGAHGKSPWGSGSYVNDLIEAKSSIKRWNYSDVQLGGGGSCNSVGASNPEGYGEVGGIQIDVKWTAEGNKQLKVKFRLKGTFNNDHPTQPGAVFLKDHSTGQHLVEKAGGNGDFEIEKDVIMDSPPYRLSFRPTIGITNATSPIQHVEVGMEIQVLSVECIN